MVSDSYVSISQICYAFNFDYPDLDRLRAFIEVQAQELNIIHPLPLNDPEHEERWATLLQLAAKSDILQHIQCQLDPDNDELYDCDIYRILNAVALHFVGGLKYRQKVETQRLRQHEEEMERVRQLEKELEQEEREQYMRVLEWVETLEIHKPEEDQFEYVEEYQHEQEDEQKDEETDDQEYDDDDDQEDTEEEMEEAKDMEKGTNMADEDAIV